MSGFDFTRTFDPAQQPDDAYCIIINVDAGKKLNLGVQFGANPKGFELDVCVYLAGARVGDFNHGASTNPTNFSWDSSAHVATYRQTFRIAGFWKDRYGGSNPWYAAVLEQKGGDGNTSWDGAFFHRQPGIFNDYCGDLHVSAT